MLLPLEAPFRGAKDSRDPERGGSDIRAAVARGSKAARAEPGEAGRHGWHHADPCLGLRGRPPAASRGARRRGCRPSPRGTADELLGLKEPKQNGFLQDRRFIRRFQEIEKLPRSEKQTLLKTIDHFLRGAQAERAS